MTPAEHAKSLIDSFSAILLKGGNSGYNWTLIAKECALQMVEEILPCTWKEETYYKKWGFTWVAPETTTEYWLDVKDEINKL